MKVLLTGIAGFIGSFLAPKLLGKGIYVIGVDNLNDYYDVNLKLDRLVNMGFSLIREEKPLTDGKHIADKSPNLVFYRTDLEDKEKLRLIFEHEKPDYVVNLAAQAGVRYSIENPYAYINSNIVGFINILENCRNFSIKHLVYASSSSVYGLNNKIPFCEIDGTNHPVSLYGATKKSNELMAHSYSHLYKIPTTGLRFFTVYGPWGRPDMSPMLFARQIFEGQEIDVFNFGNMERDFTFIDDIVEGMMLVLENIPQPSTYWDASNPDPSFSSAPYQIYNIGNNKPVGLKDYIALLEKEIGKKARQHYLPLQKGDVLKTCANIEKLNQINGFKPEIDLEEGIKYFIEWFRGYYGYK